MQESQTYVLGTGNKGAERLELQNQLLLQDSQQHVLKSGLVQGATVWDIGCGTGAMTSYLAKLVGESGRVMAMDVSDAQLELAQQRIEQEGHRNVTFHLADISDNTPLPEEQADLVYARFVLMHLKDPSHAISRMKSLLKPRGVIASQESILSTFYFSYETLRCQECLDTLIALGNYHGVDYNVGNRLEQLYEQYFKKVDSFTLQPMLRPQDTKKMFLLNISEWKAKALAAQLASEEQFSLWEKTFQALPEDDPAIKTALARQVYVLAWNE